MRSDLIPFFNIQRRIFGICPNPDCGQLFRLSDCKIYTRRKPVMDWMDEIDRELESLDRKEEKIQEEKSELQARAASRGRLSAQRQMRKIDRVFTPKKLDPDDAKVLFHPIDFVVFNGMRNCPKIS